MAARLIVRLGGPRAATRPNTATIISKGGGEVAKNRDFLIAARRVYYLVFLLRGGNMANCGSLYV